MLSVLLNTRQAAERCGLSRRTLEKYRLTGGGPLYIQLGTAVRYRVEDLESWIAAHRRRSTSDDLPTRC
jgi:predicted DNA-binding transcriptional regulator AlpA